MVESNAEYSQRFVHMNQVIMSPPSREPGMSALDFSHAESQWNSLYEMLKHLQLQIHIMPNVSYVDAFYAVSRHGFITDKIVLLAHQPVNVARQYAPYLKSFCQSISTLEAHQIQSVRLHPDHHSPLKYAGYADTFCVDDCLYFGYGSSSDHAVANDLQSKTGKRVIDLCLQDEYPFLMDAFLPVNEGQALCHPSSMHPDSVSLLAESFMLTTLQDDFSLVPSHSIVLDQTAIVSEQCYDTQSALSSLGYDVLTVDLGFFQDRRLGPRGLILPIAG